MKPLTTALEAIGRNGADDTGTDGSAGRRAGERSAGGNASGAGGEKTSREGPDEAAAPEPFRPLGEYDWPSTPVDRGLKRLVATLRERFLSKENGEGIDLSRLAAAERAMLDRIVAPPANEPLAEELDATLADWLAGDEEVLAGDTDTLAGTRVVVLPPCDEENFLRGWAEQRGLAVLEPPERTGFACPLELPGEAPAIVVVPRLEEWFLRHDTRLDGVRELIRRVDGADRRFLIGCNSWAWQFLVKSCAVDAVLPEPLMFAAFDAGRLRRWLKRLAGADGEGALRFRLARSGQDAFDEDVDRRGRNANAMSELAERSRGIPWVAWNLWRASLRTAGEARSNGRGADRSGADGADADETDASGTDAGGTDVGGADAGEGGSDAPPGAARGGTDIAFGDDDAETLWVTELRHFTLPGHDNQEALLVLHTLLVHGRLTEEEIYLTTPISRHANALGALKKSGMVRRVDGMHSCVPAAYPAIRDGLRAAGYPMDVL